MHTEYVNEKCGLLDAVKDVKRALETRTGGFGDDSQTWVSTVTLKPISS